MNANASETEPGPIPRYTASGAPVTKGYRIAFSVWVVCVLFCLVAALAFYLIDKLIIRG